jgi:hypothetical protein
MGKFGNDPVETYRAEWNYWNDHGREGPEPELRSMQGANLGPRPKDLFQGNPKGMTWHGKSEWEALGLLVPFFRRSAAIRHMKDMGFTDREQMEAIVGKMSNDIERDDSHMALEHAMRMGVDATGCYRLLAVLLCDPEPPEPKDSDATYVDLVSDTR